MPSPEQGRKRRIGRRIGQVVYYLIVVFIAFSATTQVSKQVFFPDATAGTMPWASCEEGVRGLYRSLHGATAAAERHDADVSEEAALERFRAAIAGGWAHRDAVEDLCLGTPYEPLLDALERLRYSEEHGVRHQAAELTALRRRVASMAAEMLNEPPRTSPSADAHDEDRHP